jgi:hypothetical protein
MILPPGDVVETGGSIGGWNPKCGDDVCSSCCGIIGGCQNVFPDPRRAGPAELLFPPEVPLDEVPVVPVYEEKGNSIEDREEREVVLEEGE